MMSRSWSSILIPFPRSWMNSKWGPPSSRFLVRSEFGFCGRMKSFCMKRRFKSTAKGSPFESIESLQSISTTTPPPPPTRRTSFSFPTFLRFSTWLLGTHTIGLVLFPTTLLSVYLSLLPTHLHQWFLQSVADQIKTNTGLSVNCAAPLEPVWREGCLRCRQLSLSRECAAEDQLTHFHVRAEHVDLSIDLLRWLSGFGWLSDIRMQGVRALIDRRHLDFSGVDPQTWLMRREPLSGDMDVLGLQIEDAHVTVWDHSQFRPYSLVLHHGQWSRVRLQWLLYDLLRPQRMMGELDGALFSLHPTRSRQSSDVDLNPSLVPFTSFIPSSSTPNPPTYRLKLTGLSVDMLNTGSTGPFAWIESGTVDLDVYMVHPSLRKNVAGDQTDFIDSDDLEEERKLVAELNDIRSKPLLRQGLEPLRQHLVADLKRKMRSMDGSIGKSGLEKGDQQAKHELAEADEDDPDREEANEQEGDENESVQQQAVKDVGAELKEFVEDEKVQFYFDIRLHNIRASIPTASTPSTSPSPSFPLIPTTLIRPIVAYLNAQPTSPRGRKTMAPPITGKFNIPLSHWNGSWTLYQARLLDKLSASVELTLAKMVVLQFGAYQRKGRRKRSSVVSATADPQSNQSDEEDLSEWDGVEGDDDEPEGRGLTLLARVGWYAMQAASEALLKTYSEHGTVPKHAPDEQQFVEFYNEMIWGL